jgi:hypothetical protein
MTNERAKSRTHATAPSYRRHRRDWERHWRRLAKLERKRSATPCAPSSAS